MELPNSMYIVGDKGLKLEKHKAALGDWVQCATRYGVGTFVFFSAHIDELLSEITGANMISYADDAVTKLKLENETVTFSEALYV